MLYHNHNIGDNIKYTDMNTEELLEKIFTENNLAKTTKNSYRKSVEYFEKITGITLAEQLELAEQEAWKTGTLRKNLIIYRKELYETYKKGTANEYYRKIISILNYFEIPYGKLPKLKKKHKTSLLKDISEIPSQNILKKCIESYNNPVIKASILLLSSTGMSPVDALNLTIRDYMIATSEYHNYNRHHRIYDAIAEMENKQVIATFKGYRQKTGVEYITFTSPEATRFINIYLLSREDTLRKDSKLIRISRPTLNRIYKNINDELELGVTSEGKGKFSPKNLRAFHATQLEKAGMNDNKINILEGRAPDSILRKHYIKVDTRELKEEYIKCLPYLVVDDMERVQTELDIVREEKQTLEQENKEYKENYNRIWEEINNLQARQDAWEELKKSQ